MKPIRSLFVKSVFPFAFLYLLLSSCKEEPQTIASSYTFIEPAYEAIRLEPASDSLLFRLDEKTYNHIRSFNYFTQNNRQFIAFYDRGSKSINIYDFVTQQPVRRISLKQWVNDAKLDKASVYIHDFSNIFVTTKSTFYLLDSAGMVKRSIEYYDDTDKQGFFDNNRPIVNTDSLLYIGVRPVIKETSLPEHQKFRSLYGFDMQKGTKQLYYPLPPMYQEGLYGYPYMDFSYCINDKGNFVFSFPADTNIYETNLADYHKAYYARSRYIKDAVPPLTDMEFLENGDRFRYYTLHGSYGDIFYDPYKKRYLRQAKHKVSEEEYRSKTYKKQKSIIVFDENFKIIGESVIDANFSFSSIFFTPDGKIYARTQGNDEHALHFVSLTYNEKSKEPLQLASSKTLPAHP